MLKVYFHILSFPAQVLLLQFTTVCLMLIKGSFYSQKLPFLFHSLSQKSSSITQPLKTHFDLHLC